MQKAEITICKNNDGMIVILKSFRCNSLFDKCHVLQEVVKGTVQVSSRIYIFEKKNRQTME